MSENLKKLRALTEMICQMALENRHTFQNLQPVNWADFHCIGSEKYETDDGETGYRVYISEADPTAHEITVYVYEQLKSHGFDHVDVVTEW